MSDERFTKLMQAYTLLSKNARYREQADELATAIVEDAKRDVAPETPEDETVQYDDEIVAPEGFEKVEE